MRSWFRHKSAILNQTSRFPRIKGGFWDLFGFLYSIFFKENGFGVVFGFFLVVKSSWRFVPVVHFFVLERSIAQERNDVTGDKEQKGVCGKLSKAIFAETTCKYSKLERSALQLLIKGILLIKKATQAKKKHKHT